MKVYLAIISGIDLDTRYFIFKKEPTECECKDAYMRQDFRNPENGSWNSVYYKPEDLEYIEIIEKEII